MVLKVNALRFALAAFSALVSTLATAQTPPSLPQTRFVTQPAGDNSSRVATTAYADRAAQIAASSGSGSAAAIAANTAAISAEQTRAKAAEAALMPTASALPACTAGSSVAPVPTGQPFRCAGMILIAQ